MLGSPDAIAALTHPDALKLLSNPIALRAMESAHELLKNPVGRCRLTLSNSH